MFENVVPNNITTPKIINDTKKKAGCESINMADTAVMIIRPNMSKGNNKLIVLMPPSTLLLIVV
jgi:hypothetical protein